MHDCLIIGSGVAAVSAALTLNNHKKDILWVGFSSLSDKIRRAERISNYPGLPAVSGEQFAEALRQQIAEAGLTVTEGVVTAVQPYGGRFGAAVGREFYEPAPSFWPPAPAPRASCRVKRGCWGAVFPTAPPATGCSTAARTFL